LKEGLLPRARWRRTEFEPETAADTLGAVDTDAATHQLDQPLADHQADAGAGLAARLLAEAVEGLEQLCDLGGRQPLAGVMDTHAQASTRGRRAAHVNAAGAAVVFDRVAQEVQQDLLGPHGIGLYQPRFRVGGEGQRGAAALRLERDHGLAIGEHPRQRHLLWHQRQAARLDGRQVQDFGDQAQQIPARMQDLLQAVLLRRCGGGRAGFDQLRETKHRAERRAQLMAHAQQEVRLRPVGPFGLGLGGHQRQLGLLACGDIVEQHGDLACLWLAQAKGMDIEPALHRFGPLLEPNRCASQCHRTIGFQPQWLDVGDHDPHGPPLGAGEPGMAHEGRIDLQVARIGCRAVFVKHHLDDREAGIDRVEQGPVTFCRCAQRQLGALAFRHHRKTLDGIVDRARQAVGAGPLLADVVLRAGAQQPEPILGGRAGDHHHRAGRHAGALAQRRQYFGRVHVGQHMVQQHAIERTRGLREHLANALGTEFGFAEAVTAVAGAQQHLAQVGPVVEAVVYQQDVACGSWHGGRGGSVGQYHAAQPVSEDLLRHLQVPGMLHRLDVVGVDAVGVTELQVARVGGRTQHHQGQ